MWATCCSWPFPPGGDSGIQAPSICDAVIFKEGGRVGERGGTWVRPGLGGQHFCPCPLATHMVPVPLPRGQGM